MRLDRITILGVGLMGGSLGLAVASCLKHSVITGYSNDDDSLQQAVRLGAIHQASTDPAAAVTDADLIFLCTPVGTFSKLMREIGPVLQPHAIVTDVGSTKASIHEIAARTLAYPNRFVGGHPMVGGEKHGVTNARADVFNNGLCILTTTPVCDAEIIQQLDRFWQTLHMRTVQMSPSEHDRWIADISHLPHTVAAALVRIQSPDALKLAARGFLDSTRIAAGDPVLWRDILLENRVNVRQGIVRMQQDLQALLTHLDAGDASAVEAWLASAAKDRNQLTRS